MSAFLSIAHTESDTLRGHKSANPPLHTENTLTGWVTERAVLPECNVIIDYLEWPVSRQLASDCVDNCGSIIWEGRVNPLRTDNTVLSAQGISFTHSWAFSEWVLLSGGYLL